MRSRMMVESPDQVEVTMKITMTCKEWCDLRDALQAGSNPIWTPMHHLSSAITDMLGKMRKIIYPDGDA